MTQVPSVPTVSAPEPYHLAPFERARAHRLRRALLEAGCYQSTGNRCDPAFLQAQAELPALVERLRPDDLYALWHVAWYLFCVPEDPLLPHYARLIGLAVP